MSPKSSPLRWMSHMRSALRNSSKSTHSAFGAIPWISGLRASRRLRDGPVARGRRGRIDVETAPAQKRTIGGGIMTLVQ